MPIAYRCVRPSNGGREKKSLARDPTARSSLDGDRLFLPIASVVGGVCFIYLPCHACVFPHTALHGQVRSLSSQLARATFEQFHQK